MSLFKKVIKFFSNKTYRFSVLSSRGFYNHLSDKSFICKKWEVIMGTKLNLKNPRTFNEKLQWLKLHDRKPFYTDMVDKYLAKEYVSKIIGNEYIIPTLGVWNHFDDIDFERLPNRFVLKCTHDSGGVVICKDKQAFDYKNAEKVLEYSLKQKFYLQTREWPYKNVKPRIIAEEYLEDNELKELRDYKFFCFDGQVKALFVASDRQNKAEETKFDFFDPSYNFLKIVNGHPNSEIPPSKPKNFEKMIELAEKLSKDIPHVRCDFYEVNGKVYFGELTFYHWSGLVPFIPSEWDIVFGSWLKLPTDKKF